jgi:hypothetical protein
MIVGYWTFVIEKDYLKSVPFPQQEFCVLVGVSLIVILLWILYFKLAASLEEKN